MSKDLFIKNILLVFLYASFSTPIAFFLIGLPMILQIEGFSATSIGLFQLAGISYVFIFLFSPIVDGFVFKKNHYKKWIFLISLVYISLLVFISFYSLKENYYLLFTLIMSAVFISTFLDVPLNALATKIFKEEERTIAGGYKSAAYFISGIIGNGVMLLVYNKFGWQYTIVMMALLILPSFISLYFIDEKSGIVEKEKLPYLAIFTFFKQKNIGTWILILGLYFVFISPIFMFLKPYLISKGINPDTVAILVGIYGGVVGALGSLSLSFFNKHFTKKGMLLNFTFLNIFTILVFILIEYYPLSFAFFIVATTLIALSMALSSSIVFALMMDYVRKEFCAIDYAVQSSVDAMGRIFAAVIAGNLIQNFGYKTMFIFELIGMSFVAFIVFSYCYNTQLDPVISGGD